jgi:hypothetical protein
VAKEREEHVAELAQHDPLHVVIAEALQVSQGESPARSGAMSLVAASMPNATEISSVMIAANPWAYTKRSSTR